jgi:hypothetical protein
MAVFWVVAPCRLLWVYRRFGGSCDRLHWGRNYFWNVGKLTTRHCNREGRHFHITERVSIVYSLWFLVSYVISFVNVKHIMKLPVINKYNLMWHERGTTPALWPSCSRFWGASLSEGRVGCCFAGHRQGSQRIPGCCQSLMAHNEKQATQR